MHGFLAGIFSGNSLSDLKRTQGQCMKGGFNQGFLLMSRLPNFYYHLLGGLACVQLVDILKSWKKSMSHYPQLCPCMRAVDGALEDIYFVFYLMAKISFTCGLMPRYFLTFKCIRFSCIAFNVLFSSRFCPF